MNENTELLETYRKARAASDPKFIKMVCNPFLFELFLLAKLPMGFVAGTKVKSLTPQQCSVAVPYRWLNQNPFHSTYFAVLSMAAEMSTGLLGIIATRPKNPSVSILVTRTEADFVKKATGITTFTCSDGDEITKAIERAVLTGEPQTYRATSIGTSKDGVVEAKFAVEWGFKMRM